LINEMLAFASVLAYDDHSQLCFSNVNEWQHPSKR